MAKPPGASAGRHAIVIGGSVGGLFAANLLLRRGWDVQVFEKATGGLESRGTGIAYHPETEAILALAGARDKHAPGVRVEGRCAVDAMGTVVARQLYPQYVTAWGRIFNPLRAAFPAGRYHGGRELANLSQDAGSVTAHFADGSRATAELLVGADGFRSAVRAIVAPQAVPVYAGYVGWRGLVEEREFSPDFAPVFGQFTFGFPGHGETIGYPIPGLDDSVAPGERRYNFLWYYPVDAGAALTDLLTDASGRVHAWSIPPALIRPEHIAALQRDAAARLPAPYAEAPRRARQFLVQPIYDLESPAMGFGRVALLGDAAFVARPHVGVGVLKAAEDALALAGALEAEPEVPAALMRYGAARIPPSRAAVAMSRHLGAFIERRLPRPEADPGLGLTLPRLLELSGRPVPRDAH
ncbi:FAD binding domain-containing protein [Roseicella aerolata]|uniref:FAD-dependent monooxygenase n=1 Tax=Roseicella aerolata TaxID=2883479 RepID=A0A9X1IBX2_9PROT|nr:FAD-dependent monooxygenase [Roseicella aerolata]MCB4821985.1 FAD-dependent monooxygenase [Roseicella aerolata]